MKILIKIEERRIRLMLLQNKKEIDFLDIIEEYNLSEELLPAVDKILKKNKLQTKNIERVEVKSDQGDNFTTTRIAKTVANAWNWAQKSQIN
jgi:tRNA A37 threonylcarbamoyladenosine modification protein TsaB